MVLVDYKNGFYEAKFELPRSSFNKEIIKRVCGTSFETKNTVVSLIQKKDYDTLHKVIKQFLDLKSIINL